MCQCLQLIQFEILWIAPRDRFASSSPWQFGITTCHNSSDHGNPGPAACSSLSIKSSSVCSGRAFWPKRPRETRKRWSQHSQLSTTTAKIQPKYKQHVWQTGAALLFWLAKAREPKAVPVGPMLASSAHPSCPNHMSPPEAHVTWAINS